MGYSDVFGGSSVQPADVGFRAVSLSANLVTVWPSFATTGNQCARIMKVTPTVGSLSVSLPDATLTTAGMDVLFDNPSSFSFTVLDFTGGVVATVAAGQVKYVYLSDSSTQAGTWRTTIFGVGSSTLDAASLAGYGLKALSNTLNTAAVVSNIGGSTAVTLADRSKVFVWTGGTGTLTLPSTTGSTSDFAIEVHNQGSGVMTVVTTGGVLIDGSSTIALSINESCFIHMGSTDWYTVGRGRNVQFNFTQLNKTVTGGTVALTLTEASNVVQKYSGVLLSNQIVNQPAVVQVYYVSNNTTGAYTLTFGCVGGGTSVSVTQGQAAILFCDGVNIINANTSLAGGITALVFANGSASSPSAAFGTASTGFYVSGSNEIGVTNNGVAAGKFTSGGYTASAAGAVAIQAVSAGGQADLIADRPAGSSGGHRWRSSGVDRWTLEATNTAESGANAGSNFALDAYSDAGALLGTALTVNRASQVVSFTQPPVFDGSSVTNTISPQTHAATSKPTPVDADELPITDSATSFSLKKLTWANLKATLLAWLQGTVFPAPGAIGSTTPAAGSFTTLSATGNVSSLGYYLGGTAATAAVFGNDNTSANIVLNGHSAAVDAQQIIFTAVGAERGRFSSTGLAVTGALSASGEVSSTSDLRALSGAYVYLNNAANSASANMQFVGGELITGLNTAPNLLKLSSTGLAVTGALSATGGVSGSVGTFGGVSGNNVTETYSGANRIQMWAGGVTGILTNTDFRIGDLAYNTLLTLTTSGNLGLGVTPSAWGGLGAPGVFQGSSFAIYSDSGLNTATYSMNSYQSAGSIDKYRASTTASKYQQFNGQHIWQTAPSGTAGNPITWTQAMTLDASGNLLVGPNTTAAATTPSGICSSYNAGSSQQFIGHITGTGSGAYYQTYSYGGVVIGSITQSGTTAVLYNTTSDYRLKTNQQPLTGSGAFIDALKPTTWEWTRDGRKDAGFIAHEFQEVCPNAVNGVKDETEEQEYEVTPAVAATQDAEGNELTPAVPAVMGTRTVPKYQSMQASSAEVIANLVAELQSLRKRIAILEAK